MKIIAITSCATGIAHSYMAAEAIKKIGKKHNCPIKIEIQGAMGIEDELTTNDIEGADIIVFANDVSITKLERFTKVKDKIIQMSPHEVIRNPELIFEKAKNFTKTVKV